MTTDENTRGMMPVTRAHSRPRRSASPAPIGNAGRKTSEQATLIVSVSNLSPGKGNVRFGRYDAHTRFPAEGVDLATTTMPADAVTVIARLERVPFGKYAVAVFQDENGNGQLDTALGIPTERYGFLNKATVGLGGPPAFKNAAFSVNDRTVTQDIGL